MFSYSFLVKRPIWSILIKPRSTVATKHDRPSISRWRQSMITPLRSGQGHMSVGDSAEEFMLIHVLERERLLVLSCGLPSNPLNILVFSMLEEFCLCFPHTSRRMYFYQKPGQHPPNVTGRIVSTVHQGWVGAPVTSSPHSDFTTLSLTSLHAVCGAHEITQRVMQEILDRKSEADVRQDCRQKIHCCRKIGKLKTQTAKNWPIVKMVQANFGWDLRN